MAAGCSTVESSGQTEQPIGIRYSLAVAISPRICIANRVSRERFLKQIRRKDPHSLVIDLQGAETARRDPPRGRYPEHCDASG